MIGKYFGRQKVGPSNPIQAAMINRPVAELERATRIGAAGPITVKQTPAGPQFGWGGPRLNVRWSKAVGAIPGANGDSPGQGTIAFYRRDRTNNTLISLGFQEDAFNMTPNSISDGTICGATQIDGDWYVSPMACS